jgi:RNA polymerase sigma-70 factor (ECF subfamily)
MAEASDAELLEQCLRGESRAYDALLERYQRRVISLCYRHLRNYEEACDLAQEVFVQVFQHLGDFQGKSSFSTWLYRVCLNSCYNRQRYLKAKGRGGVTSLDAMLERREGGADSSPLMRGSSGGTLEDMETAEDVVLLRQALASLGAPQRKVVELVDIEELSYEEAARILRVPLNTVRSRLSRARQELKVQMIRLRRRLED